MSNTSYITKSIINRQKRQIQVRRNILTLILSILTIVIVSISFLSFSTKANDMEHERSYKYYKSIEISKGDTLWSIANDNFDSAHYKNTREFVKEIKKMNALTSDDIVAGNHIIVPYYSSEFAND
ncbi:MAG: LysM peptidoglycan-binding domain-containing protein [Lachnospiraceae bacterium]|nr:LysM peptidoglycan-binding domain-containing protein [Lachnospiraceae bacterium]